MRFIRSLSWKTYIQLIGFCCGIFQLSGQDFSIKTYTISNGLPSSYIYCVYQDEKGYLWIGTPRGLSRFDGQHFVNYSLAEGLPNAEIDAIISDRQHRLWVGTRRGMAEMKGNRFVTYPHDDHEKVSYVFDFYETKENKVWALTKGVYEWSTSGWIKQDLYPGQRDTYVRQILNTDEGLYINYGQMLVLQKSDGDFKVIGEYHEEPKYYYMRLSKANGVIYISTIKGLYRIEDDCLIKMPGRPGQLKDIYTYFVDSQNRCWLGQENIGIQVCNLNDTLGIRFVYASDPVYNIISNFYEDKAGNIWAADLRGLVKITEKVYTKYSPFIPTNFGIDCIFLHNPENEIIINIPDKAFFKWNDNRFQPKEMQWASSKNSFRNYFTIDKIVLDQDGTNWYHTRDLGLVTEAEGIFSSQYSSFSRLGKIAFDVIFDKYRHTIIASIGDQSVPCQFDGFTFAPMQINSNFVMIGQIKELHQLPDCTLLCSTTNGSIYSIDTNNHCKLQLDPFLGNGESPKFLNDMNEGVWIYYPNNGTERYVWATDSLSSKDRLDRNKGLGSDHVWDMCFDSLGNLWVLTSKDIAVFSYHPGDSKVYRKRYSISLEETGLNIFNWNRMMTDAAGNVWVADHRNVIRFEQDKIKSLKIPLPTIQIEEIRLDQKQVNWRLYSDSLTGIFQLPVNASIPYKNNNFEIHYQGISSSGLEGVLYSYKLLPLNPDWSTPTEVNNVSFIQLPAGHYDFEIRAQLGNMVWSDPATFSFDIRQPYWETWWFRILAVLLAGVLVAFSFQARINQIRNRTRLKEQLRELELTALKSQMNPHFIHNALNSIQSLILNEHSQEASLYISKFARLLRQVLEGGDKKLITLDEEINALRLYIDLERLRMNMEFTYTEEIDDGIFLSQVKIPPVLLQPFVENALWHGLSKKEGEKCLNLRVRDQDDWLICEIKDNGIGRKSAASTKSIFPEGSLSKAVDITRKRLIVFNRESAKDPITYEDLIVNGEPAGTRVSLRIRREI